MIGEHPRTTECRVPPPPTFRAAYLNSAYPGAAELQPLQPRQGREAVEHALGVDVIRHVDTASVQLDLHPALDGAALPLQLQLTQGAEAAQEVQAVGALAQALEHQPGEVGEGADAMSSCRPSDAFQVQVAEGVQPAQRLDAGQALAEAQVELAELPQGQQCSHERLEGGQAPAGARQHGAYEDASKQRVLVLPCMCVPHWCCPATMYRGSLQPLLA